MRVCLQKVCLRLYSGGAESFQDSLSSILLLLVKAVVVASGENRYPSHLPSLL